MSYQTSPFGNGVLVGSGGNVTTNVHNQYEARDTGGTAGVFKTEGGFNELVFDVDAADVAAGAFKLLAPKLPAGAVVHTVLAKVTEAFALGGTTPTILFGTDGSEVTNGVVVSEAQGEALGTYNLTSTLTGTWAAPLAAETTVGVALGGGTPTVGAAGKIKVVIRYGYVGV